MNSANRLKLNILFLTYQGDIAGSTNSIYYLSKGLSEKGHTIVMGCRKESLLYQLLQDTSVILEPMTFRSRVDIKNIRAIAFLVKKYNIQVINAQSSLDRYTSVFTRWIFNLSVKVVHTRRQISESVGGFIQNLIYVKGTDKIVAVSNGVKTSLVAKGIPERHIKVIYNGTPKEKYETIDYKYVDNLRKRFEIKDDDFVIGCISRKKKQEQIIAALPLLNFPVKVLFVGIEQQTEYQEILNKVPKHHKIYFTGLQPSQLILNYYKLFNCFVLASTMEGLSQSLLEAMALNVPVIATHAAGNPELIQDNENGFTFSDGAYQELANKIEIIKNDETLRSKLIVNGKKTALQDFSLQKTIDSYETFFMELI